VDSAEPPPTFVERSCDWIRLSEHRDVISHVNVAMIDEFYCSPYCIGTVTDGRGEIRWNSPNSHSQPIVADFDGDGLGESSPRLPAMLLYFTVPTRVVSTFA
jgi:hypothetical protein